MWGNDDCYQVEVERDGETVLQVDVLDPYGDDEVKDALKGAYNLVWCFGILDVPCVLKSVPFSCRRCSL